MPRTIIRVAGLDTSLADALANAKIEMPGPDDWQAVKLVCKDGPNVRFVGDGLADNSGNPGRDRYEQVVLYAVKGGGFVAARAWHSNLAGEETFWTAAEVATVEQAMNAWGWSTVAKGIAKKLQWDINLYIGGRPS